MADEVSKHISDKRLHPRKQHMTGLHYYVLASPQGAGIVRDVSEGGMCALLDKPLPEGTQLRVRFTIPDGIKESSIEMIGKVIRCTKADDGFITGIQFVT